MARSKAKTNSAGTEKAAGRSKTCKSCKDCK